MGFHYTHAHRWVQRFLGSGVAGLRDRPKSGRPREYGRRQTTEILQVPLPAPPISVWVLPLGRCPNWQRSDGEPIACFDLQVVADITYMRLKAEVVYLAVILDAYSRKVVGWVLERTLAARLPLAALEQAIAERRPPPGLAHHSDRGVQYASGAYVRSLRRRPGSPGVFALPDRLQLLGSAVGQLRTQPHDLRDHVRRRLVRLRAGRP